MDYGERNRRYRLNRKMCTGESTRRPGIYPPGLMVLIGLVGRAHYPGWQFSPKDEGGRLALTAFRAHPGTGVLEKLGPWPLPEDPGEYEVREACLAAVVAVDGEEARGRFAWRK